MFFECKFTEAELRGCFQARALESNSERAIAQCNGNYGFQVSPRNGKRNRCAMSGKEIAYWDFTPKVFQFEPDGSYNPCPFRGSWFQLMRNAVLAQIVAERRSSEAAFIVVYADSSDLPIPQWLASSDWQKFLGCLQPNRTALSKAATSFQNFIALGSGVAQTHPASSTAWNALGHWIEQKIKDAVRR